MFEELEIDTLQNVYFAFIHKKSAEFRDVGGASPKIFSLSENNLNVLTNRNARYMTELNYI